MTFNKKLLAGLVAFAAASTSAQAVTVAANDGWELGVSGLVNQFMTFTDTKGGDNVNELRDGLLPAFLNFDMKAPTMNGLDIAAHISFSPSTNANSYASFEQREVYFTVDGSFGQILAGKALGLYSSHNILTDQTLFGVGYGTTGNGTTTLGGIGLGYDYASWRSQVKWTSNDMNGFKIALAIMDPSTGALRLGATGNLPTGSLTTGDIDSDNFRYEADLSYAGTFDSGSYTAWLSGMTQDEDNNGNNDTHAWTVGGTLVVGGFEAMAQYSDAESKASAVTAAAAVLATPGNVGTAAVAAASSITTEWDQFLVQAGYRFAGTTLVSAQYAELDDKTSGVNTDETEKWTVGVYHDVNSNLKLVAEYTNVENDDMNLDTDIFSLGGFVFF
ncbi:MAG: porin [Piscirickettsiaceae bacterium]|nr:porin [Piscirickettsiaceae bacterium]